MYRSRKHYSNKPYSQALSIRNNSIYLTSSIFKSLTKLLPNSSIFDQYTIFSNCNFRSVYHFRSDWTQTYIFQSELKIWCPRHFFYIVGIYQWSIKFCRAEYQTHVANALIVEWDNEDILDRLPAQRIEYVYEIQTAMYW